METYLIDYSGREYLLPVLLSWDMSYGCGLPCDAYEICVSYEPSMLPMLKGAVRMRAEHLGSTVFFGVVDEYEVEISHKTGSRVKISGRGLAALLLDNEAEAMEYFSADISVVLNDYVYPFGIKNVQILAGTPSIALKVTSGTSCYKVLENYLWFSSGLKPTFDQLGRLIIGERQGDLRIIDQETAINHVVLKDKRYGVISKVLVKNRVMGTTEVVENAEFTARGGCCQRIVNVPRTTNYDAMRKTGAYQIQCSKAGAKYISVELPTLFAAFPGDRISLNVDNLAVAGEFKVAKARCFANEHNVGTVLELESE